MHTLDHIPLLRSRIAMLLHGDIGDSSLRTLMTDAGATLKLAEQAVAYWKQRAEQAERLRLAEIDDGK